MSRRDRDRLRDIAAACTAISRYVDRPDADDEIVFDAIRARLMEIGEAVKDLAPSVTKTEPGIPWNEIARMRDHPFLGGYLRLPTGIERLAQSTGVPLLHACTRSLAPDKLAVEVEAMSGPPQVAIDTIIGRLERDVRERPWAWWHWGLWDQMWRTAPCEGEKCPI